MRDQVLPPNGVDLIQNHDYQRVIRWISKREELSDSAKALWKYLAYYAEYVPDTDHGLPPMTQRFQRLNFNQEQWIRYLNELYTRGFLSIHRRGNESTRYILSLGPNSEEFFQEEEFVCDAPIA